MIRRETIQMIGALVASPDRGAFAGPLARLFRASAMLAFVQEEGAETFVPAPRFDQTPPSGPTWDALFAGCRTASVVQALVAYPAASDSVQVVAAAGAGAVLVFVGDDVDIVRLEEVTALLPFLGATFRAERRVVRAETEMGVMRDNARRAEALAHTLHLVRTELETQAEAVSEAHARAEDALRAKDEFLAMLGHELRNPLAPIVTAIDLLKHGERDTHILDVLTRQVASLTGLVDDLLDVARITRGKIELRRTRLDLASVIVGAIEAASPLIERKRHTLSVEEPKHPVYVDGDAARLTQVFTNLLNNAAKYSPPGTSILVSLTRDGETAAVRVRDQGFGIDPSMLEAIFETFVQQQRLTENARGGLGLGLAIVKSMVTAHGGSVSAHSEGAGKGTTFTVTLPLDTTSGAVEEAAVAESLGPRSRAPARVLVVDDDREIAELIAELVAHMGFEVRVAHDGPAAIACARAFVPDVALLDLGLPVMSGYELAAALREDPLTEKTKLVAVTGYIRASDRERTRKGGFDAHLSKPLDDGRLARTIDKLVASARGGHESFDDTPPPSGVATPPPPPAALRRD